MASLVLLICGMKKVRCGKNIWPDVDGPKDVNRFLEKYGIKLSFLLYDGVGFELSDNVEVYDISSGSCYFRDTRTKDILLHYYEDFGELVFDGMNEKFTVPILEEELG